jgi:UDP-N-acetylglucosamine 2-epimerase
LRARSLPLAHVEAGLRSGDLSMPEERNRIEADRRADLLLCPDERSCDQLAAEGVPGRAEVVGDVMADACFRLTPVARERSRALEDLGLEPGGYLLLTLHREANARQPRLGRIAEGLRRLEEPVVFPVHPRTRAALDRERIDLGPRVLQRPPLGYLDLTALASQARVILTDSGGLQKEAYWHGVPCVTLRPSTEWVDTVEVGANALVDDDPDRLVAAVEKARMPNERPQLYGDGAAAARIAGALYTLRAS